MHPGTPWHVGIRICFVFARSSNEIGWTALHVATAHGQTEVVKWLSGAIVELNKETPTGFTAIHIAAQNGHVSCMMVSAYKLMSDIAVDR